MSGKPLYPLDAAPASSRKRKMNKPTFGPWKLGAHPPTYWTSILAPDLSLVATVADWNSDYTTHMLFQGDAAKADARLIAATPDLLSALKGLLAVQNGPPLLLKRHEAAWTEAMTKAVAAIAKAKG